MELNYQILKELIGVDSPSGFCGNVIKFLDEYISKLGYKIEHTKKGNVVVKIKGENDYTKTLSSHVDTLGLMVRSINNDGTLNFTPLGGPLLNTYNGEYCKIYTRSGIIYTGTVLSKACAAHVHPNSRDIALNEENMIIRLDEIVYNKLDVLNLGINTGDIIAVDPKFEITKSGFVKTRFLDDKASSFLLLELLRYFKENNVKLKNNLNIIFTTYEEVGHGASYIPETDEMLAVDMGCIGLDLNCNEEMVSICVKDSSGPYDYDMVTNLEKKAKELKLNYCLDVYPRYSSDASSALRGGQNIKAALIGPGIAASHGMERCHIHSLENTFKLLLAYLEI